MTSTPEPHETLRSQAGSLLVFTLGPRGEARRHPLLPERFRTSEVELRQACLDSVIAAGHETGLRVLVSSPRPFALAGVTAWHRQDGPTFGDRLRGAVRAAFASAQGSPLVLVGSDSPGLGATHVEQALRALAGDPESVVLGPSEDGGFYLLAAARPVDEILAAVAWCGSGTRRTLIEALAQAGRPVLMLEPLADLDEPADLARWVRGGIAHLSRLRALAHSLSRLLQNLCRPSASLVFPRAQEHLYGPRLGRAPPLLPSH